MSKITSYEAFCDAMFKKHPMSYVASDWTGTTSGTRTSATCVDVRTGKCMAVWVPRLGVVWERKEKRAK